MNKKLVAWLGALIILSSFGAGVSQPKAEPATVVAAAGDLVDVATGDILEASPRMPLGGLGELDPWVDARGDLMFGDLDLQANALILGGEELRISGGYIQFNGRRICLEGGIGTCGTLTSISSGAGLTGGPITTTGTLSIAPLGVTTGMLALDSVTGPKILDASITNADISAAAGIGWGKLSLAGSSLGDLELRDASVLTGILPDTVLAANVARLDREQTVTGATTFGAPASFNEIATFAGPATFEAETTFSSPASFDEVATFAAPATFEASTTFTAPASFDEVATFAAPATFEASTTFTAPASFDEVATFAAPATFEAVTTFTAPASFDEVATFAAPATFEADTTFTAPASFDEVATFAAPATFEADTTFTAPASFDEATTFAAPATFDANLAIGGTPADSELLIRSTDGGSADLVLESATGNTWSLGSASDGAFHLAAGTGGIAAASLGDGLTITPEGNVGIGTTTPSAKLEVVGDVKWSGTLQAGSVPWARLTNFPASCASGQFVSAVGISLVCATPVDTNSGGTVTSVATGAGLTGGPISTSGTVSIATGGVTGAMLQDGTIGSADINTAQVQGRVTGVCAVGSSIRVVNTDGTVACEVDTDTTYTAGSGLSLVGTAFSVNTAAIQNRVTGVCGVGSSIRVVNADGTVTCQTDANSGGTVTSVATGAGLTGGTITGSGTVSIATGGVTSPMVADGTIAFADWASNSCATNQVPKWNGAAWACAADIDTDTNSGGTVTSVATGAGLTGGTITGSGTVSIATGGVTSPMVADGTIAFADWASNSCAANQVPKWNGAAWACAADVDTNSGGTVTSVGSGFGLTGGPVTGSGTLAVDTNAIQRRVTGACAGGQAIRVIAADGTVTCDAGSNDWKLTGNAGTIAGSNFLGTTDNQPVEFKVNNVRTLRLQQFGNVIGGAASNSIAAGGTSNAVISGGFSNSVTLDYGSIGGGGANTASSLYAHVGGGTTNTASGASSTVAGGNQNRASGEEAFVGGGERNTASSTDAVVAGGHTNTASGSTSTVGGGITNSAIGESSTVAGGWLNSARGIAVAIGGGKSNTAGDQFTVGEGYDTIGGGLNNLAKNGQATVGGGDANQATGPYTTVAGGQGNWATTQHAAIGGGVSNRALGSFATVAGGQGNNASAQHATVGGGSTNRASGAWATVPGGDQNVAAGGNSFAAGLAAQANHDGSFVWADRTFTQLPSTAANQFSARAVGGFRMMTSATNTGQGCFIAANGAAWSCSSDRDLKADFAPVDVREVLAKVKDMPVSTWRYQTEAPGMLHMGPMAQDFQAAFGLGDSARHIGLLDEGGVALAAIQGLAELVEQQQAQLEEQSARIAALEAALAAQV